MTLLIYSALMFCAVGLLLYAVFNDLPSASVDLARNNLFGLRDRLFQLGASGRVEFNSPAYQIHRGLLNALIRYSHEISVTHMILSRLFTSSSAQESVAVVKRNMDKDAERLPEDVQKELKCIFDAAHTEMVMLMINRSVLFTIIMRTWWIADLSFAAFTSVIRGFKNGAEGLKQGAAILARVDVGQVRTASSFRHARDLMAPKIDGNAFNYVASREPALEAA